MRILLAGQPRTGTSALLQKVHGAMGPGHEAWYEPTLDESVRFKSHQNIVVKVLLFPGWFDHVDPGHYDRCVLIVRDPRDAIISTLLWWVSQSNWRNDRTRLRRFFELLRIKERDPGGMSLLTLIHTWSRFEGKSFLKMYDRQLRYALEWHQANNECYVFTYTDLIEGKVEALSAYLDLALNSETETDSSLRLHRRTMSSGNWRHWFTLEDSIFFELFFAKYRDFYQMNNDWQLSAAPHISTKHSSEFVMRLMQGNNRWNEVRGAATHVKSLRGNYN